MAFPQVASTSKGSGTSSGGMPVTLPAGVVAGDLLVVVAGWDLTVGDVATMGFTGTGWAKRAEDLSSANIAAVYEKIADGTDGLTVTLTGNSLAESGTYVAYRITGHDVSAAVEVASQDFEQVDGATSATPNPPGLTPSWGAADTLWIAAASWDNAARTLSSYPTNYTANQLYADGATTSSSVGTAAATRELTAASEDPGVFTISLADQWSAFTIAIKPAGSGGGSGVSTTISATTAPAVASITGEVAPAAVQGTISATTAPAVSSVTGSAASTSNNFRLSIGIQTERGGPFVATGWRYTIFADDARTAVEQSGTVDTTAAGLAVIDINTSPNWIQGDWVPVMMTQYNAALPAADRVIRTMFGFVQAQAQP